MVNKQQHSGDIPLEDRVRAALRREADAVEPSADGLRSIRERTTRVAAGRARARWFGAGAAALATAAAVTGVVLAGQVDLGRDADEASPAAPVQEAQAGATQAVTVFYLDATPEQRGEPGSETTDDPRLYREVHRVDAAGTPVEAAVRELAASTPADLDYVNPWSGTTVNSVEVLPDEVVVDVDRQPAQASAGQQLAHTVQAAAGREVPVVVRVDGVDGPPQQAGPPGEVFARIWVTAPRLGATVSSPVTFSGRASTFEGNVAYEIKQGAQVVASGATIAPGGAGQWSRWSFTEQLEPGDYTLVTFDEDPALGGRRDVDTKDFTVR